VHAIGDALESPLLSNADIPKYNYFLFGILLVMMMLLRPEGIIPNRQRREELHEGEEDESVVEPTHA
jgi:branched-chain amino acid transport system permease protein